MKKKYILIIVTAVLAIAIVFALKNDINSYINIVGRRQQIIYKEKQLNLLKENLRPITLIYLDKTSKAKKFTLADTELKKLFYVSTSTIEISVDQNLLKQSIKEVSNDILIPAKDEVFDISTVATSTFKVNDFKEAENGIDIDYEDLSSKLRLSLTKENPVSIEIKKRDLVPKIYSSEYGINEVLGTGYSSFVGSDKERDFNIRAALKKIDGVLIPPGETYSLLKNLTPFNKENGYVDGLVIKGDEILPESGGGMCQISTTLFRAAMNSGLQIVERTNHSLWLSWYNDLRNGNPGTDATIYETENGKGTDFKFKNNTDKYLMIKVRVDKSGHLYIDLLGQSDGRIATFSEPEIIKSYEATTTVRDMTTTLLPPGKKLCNGPFKGASASFAYSVTDKDGKEKIQNFYSYYRPQERICNTGI